MATLKLRQVRLKEEYSFDSNVTAEEFGGGSTTELQIGDKVILGNFSHEVYGNGNRPSAWHWIWEFDQYIGQTFTIRKIEPRNVARLEECKSMAGFPFHWLTKVYSLPEELFEI